MGGTDARPSSAADSNGVVMLSYPQRNLCQPMKTAASRLHFVGVGSPPRCNGTEI